MGAGFVGKLGTVDGNAGVSGIRAARVVSGLSAGFVGKQGILGGFVADGGFAGKLGTVDGNAGA